MSLVKNIFLTIIISGLLLPSLALAQNPNKTVGNILKEFQDILNLLIPIIIGIGLLFFLIGIVNYVTAGEDEEKQKQARNMMLYGIVALFVMVAVWGLVSVLGQTFLSGQYGTAPPAPKIPDK